MLSVYLLLLTFTDFVLYWKEMSDLAMWKFNHLCACDTACHILFPVTHLFPSSEIPDVFHCKGGKILEQVAQRSWRSPIPAGIQVRGALSSLVQWIVPCPRHFECISMIIKAPSKPFYDASMQDTKNRRCYFKACIYNSQRKQVWGFFVYKQTNDCLQFLIYTSLFFCLLSQSFFLHVI